MKYLFFLSLFLFNASATQKTGSHHNLVAIEDKDEVFCEYGEAGCEKDASTLNLGNTDDLLEDDFMGMVEDFPSFVEEGDDLVSAVDWPESSLPLETAAEAEVEYEFPLETVTLQFDSEDWPEEPNFAETLAGEPIVYDEPVETVFVELGEESESAAETESVLLEYEITEISNMDANLMETNAEPEMDYSAVTETVLVESDSDSDEWGEMDANLEETGAGEYFETVQPDIETVSAEVDSSDMEMDSNLDATGAQAPSESIESVTETVYVEMEDTDISDVDSNLEATGAEEIPDNIDAKEKEISFVEIDDEATLDPNLEETGAVIDPASTKLEE